MRMRGACTVPARAPARGRATIIAASSSSGGGDSEPTTAAPGVATTVEEPQEGAPVHDATGNGSTAPATTVEATDDKPTHLSWRPDAAALPAPVFAPLSSSEAVWTNIKLAFALPWRRFKRDSVLTFKLEGEISDQLQGRFSPGFSMPQILDSLEKAALDPRIAGIAVEISPLAVWRGREGGREGGEWVS